VTDQTSHPYKAVDKIIGLYILIFKVLDRRREDETMETVAKQELPEFADR
jgi:hypothetical protein